MGTAYKQESKQKAIKIGLKYFGTKMVKMVEAVEKITTASENKTVLVHCWRGRIFLSPIVQGSVKIILTRIGPAALGMPYQ